MYRLSYICILYTQLGELNTYNPASPDAPQVPNGKRLNHLRILQDLVIYDSGWVSFEIFWFALVAPISGENPGCKLLSVPTGLNTQSSCMLYTSVV